MSNVRNLADLIVGKDKGTPLARQWGVVTVVVAGPPKTVTVTISGSTTSVPGIRYLSSYTPTVNDVVLIDQDGTDLVVIGKLA